MWPYGEQHKLQEIDMHTASKFALAAAGFLLTLSLSTVARAQVYLDAFKTSYTGWSYLSTT